MSAEDAVSHYPLPYQPTQATATGKTPLSFQEMQSRITHNHLAIEPETNKAIYVDQQLRVVLVEFNGVCSSVSSQ